MKAKELVFASDVIVSICQELNYSRAHVAKVLRDYSKELGAMKTPDGRWHLPIDQKSKLRQFVKEISGRRYKLGERGSHK